MIPGLSTIKLIGVLVILAMITAAVGYHFVVVKGLNTQLNIERANNATLAANNGKLQVANENLGAALKAQQEQTQMIVSELNALTQAQNDAQKELAATNDFLTKQSTVKKVTELRTNPKAAPKLLDLINDNSNCTWAHIYDKGKCQNGKWIPATPDNK